MAPIVPLFVGAGLVALITVLLKEKDAKADTTKKLPEKEKEISPKVRENIEKAEKTKDPKHLKAAEVQARKEGKPQQAKAIKKAYDGQRVAQGTVTYKAPLPSIKPEKWTTFANCMKGPNVITPAFAMGLFGFSARRLVDLKVMKNPRQGDYKGRKVWTGDWVPPMTINKFMADQAFQYKVFLASMKNYIVRIGADPKVKATIGTVIDGKRVTLSGLLAVAHKAGFAGLKSWLANPKDRKKFVATTAAFNKCNGLF